MAAAAASVADAGRPASPVPKGTRLQWLYDVLADQGSKHELSKDANLWLRNRMAQSDIAQRDPSLWRKPEWWEEKVDAASPKIWEYGVGKFNRNDQYPVTLEAVMSDDAARKAFRSFVQSTYDEQYKHLRGKVGSDMKMRAWCIDTVEAIAIWNDTPGAAAAQARKLFFDHVAKAMNSADGTFFLQSAKSLMPFFESEDPEEPPGGWSTVFDSVRAEVMLALEAPFAQWFRDAQADYMAVAKKLQDDDDESSDDDDDDDAKGISGLMLGGGGKKGDDDKDKKVKLKRRELDVDGVMPDFPRPRGWMPRPDEAYTTLCVRVGQRELGSAAYAVVRVDSKTQKTGQINPATTAFMDGHCAKCQVYAARFDGDGKCPTCKAALIKEWMEFELLPSTQYVEVSLWSAKDQFLGASQIAIADILDQTRALLGANGAAANEDGVVIEESCVFRTKDSANPSERVRIQTNLRTRRSVSFVAYTQIFEAGEQNNALSDKIRGLVSKKKLRFRQDGFDLDLTYITPRIIAMGYPSVGQEGMYRNHLKDVQRFFQRRHSKAFKVYNLCSERKYDPALFNPQGGKVARYPFPDHNPCPFDVMEAFCEDVRAYLDEHPQNVVAIHCKAGKGRTGTLIAAYLCYVRHSRSCDDALYFFGQKRTKNSKGVTIPSQMRYVRYFDKHCRMVKSGQTPPGRITLFIEGIILHTLPKADQGDVSFVISFAGTDLKFKNRVPGVKEEPANGHKGRVVFDFRHQPIVVREDVMVSFKGSKKLFTFWFNTRWESLGQTDEYPPRPNLVFEKGQLDKAIKDCKKHKKFDPEFRVEIIFSRNQQIVGLKSRELAELGPLNVLASPRPNGAGNASSPVGAGASASAAAAASPLPPLAFDPNQQDAADQSLDL